MCVRRATPWLTSVTFDKDYSTLLYPFSVVKVSCKATDTKSGALSRALSRALPVQAKTGLADTVLAETTILTDKLGDRWHISSTLVVPGNWSHRVGTRKLGSMRRLVRLIKCREVGGDLELSGFKV